MEPSRAFQPLRPALVALAFLCVAAPGGDAAELQTADGEGEPGNQRYADRLDADSGPDPAGFQRRVGAAVVTFDSAGTDALVAAGWQPPAPAGGGDFANLGERVTTFVAIAEALGLDPAVGAQQANWGTPAENGTVGMAAAINDVRYRHDVAGYDIAELERHRADAVNVLAGMRAAPPGEAGGESTADTIAGLEAEIASVDSRLAEIRAQQLALAGELVELEAALALATGEAEAAAAPPGWASADLDVTGDGVVNRADLDAALAGQRPADEGSGVAQ